MEHMWNSMEEIEAKERFVRKMWSEPPSVLWYSIRARPMGEPPLSQEERETLNIYFFCDYQVSEERIKILSSPYLGSTQRLLRVELPKFIHIVFPFRSGMAHLCQIGGKEERSTDGYSFDRMQEWNRENFDSTALQ